MYYSKRANVLVDTLFHLFFHLRAYIFVEFLLLCCVQEAPQSAAVDGKYRVHIALREVYNPEILRFYTLNISNHGKVVPYDDQSGIPGDITGDGYIRPYIEEIVRPISYRAGCYYPKCNCHKKKFYPFHRYHYFFNSNTTEE